MSLAELVAQVRKDPEAYTAAEDAFRLMAPILVENKLESFLLESPLKIGDRWHRWEYAAAFLLAQGQAARESRDTHPLTYGDLALKHGPSAIWVNGEKLIAIEGSRYEAHDYLPCWREAGGETCESHGAAIQELQDFATGEELRGCPRCCMEGA